MAAKLAANIAAMRSVPGRTTRSAWQARSRWSLDDPPARRTSIPPRVYITPPRRRGRVTSPRVMLLADRRAPCRPILPRTLPACPDAECPLPRRPPESAAAPEAMRFPPSVFPLWKPPFQIPPFQADSTKGANRRGQPHGGLSGKRRKTAEESAVFFSAVFGRRPTGGPAPAAAESTPCARPHSWGQRVGRAGNGSRTRTLPALQGPREARGKFTAQELRGGFSR